MSDNAGCVADCTQDLDWITGAVDNNWKTFTVGSDFLERICRTAQFGLALYLLWKPGHRSIEILEEISIGDIKNWASDVRFFIFATGTLRDTRGIIKNEAQPKRFSRQVATGNYVTLNIATLLLFAHTFTGFQFSEVGARRVTTVLEASWAMGASMRVLATLQEEDDWKHSRELRLAAIDCAFMLVHVLPAPPDVTAVAGLTAGLYGMKEIYRKDIAA